MERAQRSFDRNEAIIGSRRRPAGRALVSRHVRLFSNLYVGQPLFGATGGILSAAARFFRGNSRRSFRRPAGLAAREYPPTWPSFFCRGDDPPRDRKGPRLGGVFPPPRSTHSDVTGFR